GTGSRGLPPPGAAPAGTHRCAEHRPDEPGRLLPQLPGQVVQGRRRRARPRAGPGSRPRAGVRHALCRVEVPLPARSQCRTAGQFREEQARMNLNEFRTALRREQHLFAGTVAFIAEHYHYTPRAFTNGGQQNAAGQNEVSCKLLGLALLEGLTDEEALWAFGKPCASVLATPECRDDGNIRALMKTGLAGVVFEELPLVRKAR